MTSTTDGRGILGRLRSTDGPGAVRMEERYDTDIADLWSALTEPGRLLRWLGEVEELFPAHRDLRDQVG